MRVAKGEPIGRRRLQAADASCLAPAAFHQHPSIAAFHPVMSFPTCARPRWLFPAAGDPHVRSAIPVVIARDPDITTTGRNWAAFNDGARRSNANVNVGGRGGHCQSRCQNHSTDYFLHHALVQASHGPVANSTLSIAITDFMAQHPPQIILGVCKICYFFRSPSAGRSPVDS